MWLMPVLQCQTHHCMLTSITRFQVPLTNNPSVLVPQGFLPLLAVRSLAGPSLQARIAWRISTPLPPLHAHVLGHQEP